MPDNPNHRREEKRQKDRVWLDPGNEIYEMLHNESEYS